MSKRLLHGGAVLVVSQILGQFFALGRNVLVARLLTPYDFGIASIFAMVILFTEMISNFSIDRLLVQASDGDEVGLQTTAQFLLAMRGAVGATVLLLGAWPIAHLFSIPETFTSFLFLALIPLFSGVIHLDPKRLERHMRFWPYASIELTSQFVIFALVYPLVSFFHDYRAMLWLLIIKTLVVMVGTHLVAERKYRWDTNKDRMMRFVRFGWPLLFNGFLLFFIMQGDRFILGAAKKIFGSSYGMEEVGIYSAAFILIMAPGMILCRSCSTLLLPVLSAVKDKETEFWHQAEEFSQYFAILAVLFMSFILLFGNEIFTLVYGDKYKTGLELIFWCGIYWSFRIMRMLPDIFVLAKGKTTLLLKFSVVRCSLFVSSVLVVFFNLQLTWLIIAGCFAEIFALIFTLYLTKRYMKQPEDFMVKAMKVLFASSVFLTFCNIVCEGNRVDVEIAIFFAVAITFVCSCLFLPNVKRFFIGN